MANNISFSDLYFGRPPVQENQFGLEIELENFPLKYLGKYDFWSIIEDASLRNNGKELVSNPLNFDEVEAALLDIEKDIIRADPNARCGIHVHSSVNHFTVEEIKKLLLLYMLYEPIFFHFSGNREENSFCVPLHGSYFAEQLGDLVSGTEYKHLVNFIESYGRKYYSCNVLPVLRQGTVEFRHHKASNNVVEIFNFVSLINSLFTLVRTKYLLTSVTDLIDYICNLNYTSAYLEVTKDLLSPTNYNNINYDSLQKELRMSVFNLRVIFNKLKVN